MENLEGNLPIVPKITREVHCRHAAAPELALEAVAIGECVGERGGRHIAHGPALLEGTHNLWSPT